GVLFIFHNYGGDLPEYRQLANYEPPVMTRVYGGDGRLLAEYAVEKRVFVPIKAMPRRVVEVFLAAEDKNFYTHPGVDLLSVVRAALTNVKNLGSSKRPVGASTITQQMAKNFLLTNEISWKRKIQEAILAFRIERALSKDRILELYMNEIYLGFGSYGVAAAALNYFDKSLNDLTIGEAAFLAALPKAPNNYNPITKPQAAKSRRDWVIGRMLAEGIITAEQADQAQRTPLTVRQRSATEYTTAEYFAEEVRRELVKRYGDENLYKGGLLVRTTIVPHLQAIADRELRRGLEAYDRRHGWRGPIARLAEGVRVDVAADWQSELAKIAPPAGLGAHKLAVVVGLDANGAVVGLGDGAKGRIPFSQLQWARRLEEGQKRGPKVTKAAEVLAYGDVIAVDPIEEGAEGYSATERTFSLYQIPNVDGALVALDPHTGRVLAMSGGYSFERSQFNRVTQANRQPGSAFKPFVYLAAIEGGYTPSTLILDAPFVIDQGPGLPKWRPANYTNKFYGPSTMRLGLEKSRNLMTVRLAQTVGMEKVAAAAERFGVVDKLPEALSMALGSSETTLLRLTTAYAMLVNGGKQITPTLIDRIQDRHGATIFRHDRRPCPNCRATAWTDQPVPQIPDTRKALTDPGSAYQVVNMLRGVIERGTGKRIQAVGKPLAGKTGTTNDEKDTWFIGFTPDLAVGVFIGFDEPKPLGRQETGSSVSAPVFRDFMVAALKDKPAIPFRIPPNIRLVRVNVTTGELARPGDSDVILEAFKPGTVPAGRSEVLEGQSWIAGGEGLAPATGTGGLY
ncbi:MAG: penicillin-binding protein 1A, partial [Rhodospirillales bacterium]|nr:penicillin-binding protein 1A [Rhodospirillales bacterium]